MARLTSEEQDTAVIGFLDESTKAVHANTARMWSVGKPYRMTNYTVDGVKVSGFYALNGNSVLTRLADIKSTSICDMLIAVRDANGDRPIVMILDNASNHHSKINGFPMAWTIEGHRGFLRGLPGRLFGGSFGMRSSVLRTSFSLSV